MNNPAISVIIPVFKVQPYVGRCTEALMNQTFDDVEFIFVDDATPDKSVDIIKDIISKYPSRLENCRLIHHDVNRGLTAARNTGLKAARGKYILHSDSDDWMDPTMLEDMYSVAVKHNADIVYSDFWMETGDETEYFHASRWIDGDEKNIEAFITSPWTVVWNMLVKRSLYVDNGIRSNENTSFCEDFNLSVKLLLVSKETRHIEKALYHYNRTNVCSMTHQYDLRRIKSEQEAYNDVAEFMKQKGVLQRFERVMDWRFLRSKDPLLTRKEELPNYLAFHPESHQFILSCPYMSNLRKIMAWCLTHHMKLCTLLLIDLRTIMGKEL